MNTICMCRFSFNIILFHPILQLVPGFSCRHNINDALWINKGFPSVSLLISMGVNDNTYLQSSFYVLKADYITSKQSRACFILFEGKHLPQYYMCAQQYSDKPSLPRRLIKTFRCLPEGVWDPRLPTECSVKTLIRMRGCTSWYEFSLGAYTIL